LAEPQLLYFIIKMLSWPKYKLRNLTIYLPCNFFHFILAIGHVCFVRLPGRHTTRIGTFYKDGKKVRERDARSARYCTTRLDREKI